MIHAIEYLTAALKSARRDRKLSQRALAQKVGMPQASISKIENAAVDLQTSTLVNLARALDLEVVLVPRHLAPVVDALTDADARGGRYGTREQRPLYRLDDEDDDD